MKNRKAAGISLVALVITIIVLIILTGAVIVTFMEGGIIDRAKEAVFKNDMRTYQEILALKRAEEQMEMAIGSQTETKLNASDLEEIQEIIPEFKEEYEGIVKITDGQIVLHLDYETEATMIEQEWLEELGIVKALEDRGIIFRKISDDELAVGDEIITTNGEKFYVIGFSSDNTKVNLLAKYNLKADGSSQDATGALNGCTFCTEEAWEEASIEGGENLNNVQSIQSDTTSAVYKAKEYGESLGVTGRLLLNSEANELKTTYPTIIGGRYEEGSYLNYWLAFAPTNANDVAALFGSGNGIIGEHYYDAVNKGVRPVVEVLVSSIR